MCVCIYMASCRARTAQRGCSCAALSPSHSTVSTEASWSSLSRRPARGALCGGCQADGCTGDSGRRRQLKRNLGELPRWFLRRRVAVSRTHPQSLWQAQTRRPEASALGSAEGCSPGGSLSGKQPPRQWECPWRCCARQDCVGQRRSSSEHGKGYEPYRVRVN